MSKEGDRAAVFRTTKVRTKLKGDCSWMQSHSEPQAETEAEKPWIAEVRASRLNGAPIETSPAPSPTKSTPPLTKPDTERAPTSGYLIRGVFTKLDDKPASSSTSNGFSNTGTQFSKKPSETYKRIAPHTVRPTSENLSDQLSTEEQEKRTEAASSVLKKSTVRQRSYVLSAAKKFESKDPETSVVNSSTSFVAKRVEIVDDDEGTTTPSPVSSPLPAPVEPVTPITSVSSAPKPKPRKIGDASMTSSVDVTVDEPVTPKVQKTAEDPGTIVDLAPMPIASKDPFEDMKPGCTKVATPLPELIPVFVQAVNSEPEPEAPDDSVQGDAELVKLTPTSPTQESTTPPSSVLTSTVPESSASLFSTVTAILTVTELDQNPEPETEPDPEPQPQPALEPKPKPEPKVEPKPKPETKLEPKPEPESQPSSNPSSSVEALAAFYDSLITFDSKSTSLKDEPEPAQEEGGSADTRTSEISDTKEPLLAVGSCEVLTDDLLALDDGPEESAQPVPPSPGRWSQDLLGELDSEAEPTKTSGALDLLSNDVIPINTGAHSHSAQPEEEQEEEEKEEQKEEEKQSDKTAKETESTTETVTVTTTTVIITDKSEQHKADPWSSHVATTFTESSSADPFDPYPIGTTSQNSSSDLLQPLADISINSAPINLMENNDPSPETNVFDSVSGDAMKSLTDDLIPINTTSLSTRRSWAHTWEVNEESQKSEPGGQAEDQQTVVMFERKSTENDSPWDRWTSPTVYTITTTTEDAEEEEEAEEGSEDTHMQTVTTFTTVREIHTEPEPAMDRYETYSRTVVEEDQHVQTPEPETKKGIVYVKEYVNVSELAMHNVREITDSGEDYLTSSSTSYSYRSPSYSRASLFSTCTYCGEQVGNDAKITIEHLNINCHPSCFKCGVCSKPMGDLLYSMFLHGGKVHCESCYSKALD